MEENLIKKTFGKAAQESGRTTKNGIAGYLSEKLKNEYSHGLSQRTIVRIYDQYLLGDDSRISAPKTSDLSLFAQYLGYEDYADFIANSDQSFTDFEIVDEVLPVTEEGSEEDEIDVQENEKEQKTVSNEYHNHGKGTQHIGDVNYFYQNKSAILISFLALFVLSTFLIIFFSKEDKFCMIWNKNRYESVDCSKVISSETPRIEIGSEEVMHALMKLRKVEIDESTPFFSENEKPLIWFSTLKDEYEFFNSSGKHPITGEKLKPVTPEFISTYFGGHVPETINPVEKEDLQNGGTEDFTGSYCFNNTTSENLTVSLESDRGSMDYLRSIRLKPNEMICINNFPLGAFTYKAYEQEHPRLIQSGSFNVTKNASGTLSIVSKPEEAKADPENGRTDEKETSPPTDIPGMDLQTCEVEKTGDYCITNSSNQKVTVRINDVLKNSPLSTLFRTITIQAHSRGCFYDLKEGNYLALINRNENPYDLTGAESINFRIRRCTESKSEIH